MKTVILAAGKGTRMKSLTAETPKPMLNVGGKPILEHILIKLKEIGLKEFGIIVGYLSHKIKDYFKDGKNWEIKINYIEQSKQNGTGAAVLLAKEYVEKEEFILTNGDIWITKNDFRNFIDFTGKNNPDILLSLTWVEDPYFGGAIYIDKNNQIIKIIEKPEKGKSTTNYINAGLYFFKPIIFKYLEKIKPSARGEYELPDAITMLLNENKYKIMGYILKDKWLDIGTPEQLELLKRIIKE